MRLSVLGLDRKVTNNKKQEDIHQSKKTYTRRKDKNYRSHVVILYVEGISERVNRVLKKYGVATSKRPPQSSDVCLYTQRIHYNRKNREN